MTASPDLPTLLDSWTVHLRAERKSPQTIKSYTDGVRLFLAWCRRTGTDPALTRRAVNAFVADILDGGAEPATARSRQLAVRRFSAWLAEEDEVDRDDLLGLKAPKLDTKIVDSLTDDQLLALIKACEGKAFRDRRDEELLALTLPEVDITRGSAVVRRGKGGKARTVTFGARTGRSLDRYLRARRTHRLAGSPVLWLGDRGKEFGYYALRDTLRYRAERAGVDDFHPHRLRHTMASRWLDHGGSEGGLMAAAGWTRREMLDRYTRATSERRAADEARRLALGEM